MSHCNQIKHLIQKIRTGHFCFDTLINFVVDEQFIYDEMCRTKWLETFSIFSQTDFFHANDGLRQLPRMFSQMFHNCISVTLFRVPTTTTREKKEEESASEIPTLLRWNYLRRNLLFELVYISFKCNNKIKLCRRSHLITSIIRWQRQKLCQKPWKSFAHANATTIQMEQMVRAKYNVVKKIVWIKLKQMIGSQQTTQGSTFFSPFTLTRHWRYWFDILIWIKFSLYTKPLL